MTTQLWTWCCIAGAVAGALSDSNDVNAVTPGQVIIIIAFSVVLGIWAACTPPADERDYPEYWGP